MPTPRILSAWPHRLLALAVGFALLTLVASAAPRDEIVIGYQKFGVLLLAKQLGALDEHFKAANVRVRWVEFPSGPPLLEALNVGSVDFGATGDAPPIFAQAARASLLYVGAMPASGAGAAILLPKGSEIKTLADLKGRRVAFTKGTSAHTVILGALEKAGLEYKDITPAFLSPADAQVAFSRGSVDAWSIWDPYFAIAEKGEGVRVLALANDIVPQNSFFLANKEFAASRAPVLQELLAELGALTEWANAHRDEAAAIFARETGLPIESQQRSLERTEFKISPLTEGIVAEQQKIADRFHKLGILPVAVRVGDIVWKPKS